MKIYFTAAISDVSEEIVEHQNEIIEELEKQGHEVLSELKKDKDGEYIRTQSEEEALAVQRKISEWKKQADVVIVEVSVPSIGVGQEITEALLEGKQVIALYLEKKKRPNLLRNIGEDSLHVAEYTKESLEETLRDYISYAESKKDTRFNFFISPQIGAYLDWIARNKRVPRAVYLRNLIKKDMKENEEYNS